MKTWGRRVRFTAVLAVVVLALTGFSRGHSHSRHRSGGGSGGGGCSSSRQDHDTSTSSGGTSTSRSGTGGTYTGGSYGSRPTHRATATPSGGGGTAQPLQDASARLVSCATGKKPYTTAEVRNPNDRDGSFGVQVTFLDRDGAELGRRYVVTKVSARATRTLRVDADASVLGRLDHCEVTRAAAAVR
ncbi:hypothetical protein [Streptomyces anandii]|uniref:Secreted protein n=1 Tax=Streptomyces anandii TaxID=285454 RepID=A0ABW6GZP4_9ACTN